MRRSSTNLWHAPTASLPNRSTRGLLEQKIIGGLPLGRFYPELNDCMLLCATEMSKRQDMDAVGAPFK